jgi:hypothetical protein
VFGVRRSVFLPWLNAASKMKSLAIALRAFAVVLLLLAAYRLAVDLSSSLEIDTTQNGALTTIDHRFAMNRGTAILGLVGVGMFWCSFVIGRRKA